MLYKLLMSLLSSPRESLFDHWISPWLDAELYALDETGALPGLENLLDESVLRGGKRLRPILTAEFGALFGISPTRLIPFAKAVEYVHSATLAHDDVIDESDRRRGIPTLNFRIENRRAVLGGDYLLAEGLSIVSREQQPLILDSLIGTLRELVTGELLQNEGRGRVDITREHLNRVSDLKTASLFRLCCGISPLLERSDESVLRLTREFASQVGLAFQFIDDALDYSTGTGKPQGQDLREGLVNAVTCELMKRNPVNRSYVEQVFAGAESQGAPWSDQDVRETKNQIQREAEEHIHLARAYLLELSHALERSNIKSLPGASERLQRLLDKMEGRKK